jgi:hypothetical protein
MLFVIYDDKIQKEVTLQRMKIGERRFSGGERAVRFVGR